MKSFISASIVTLSFLGSALALPTTVTRQVDCSADPGPQGVIDAINAWRSDVVFVNNFLNTQTHLRGSDLANAAQATFNKAIDEPTQLDILSKVCANGAEDAINLLKEVFGNVPNSLQTIIDNPNDDATIHTAVNTINNVRCLNVLPSLDKLWSQTASDEGVNLPSLVNVDVPRPAACANIS
jgi:hypothetical protein